MLAVDLVGFGKTGKPNPACFLYDQAGRIRHLIAFIETLGLGRASLAGNSLSGMTSLGRDEPTRPSRQADIDRERRNPGAHQRIVASHHQLLTQPRNHDETGESRDQRCF